MHISGNIIDGSVVALSTGYNGLGNSDDIPVVQGDVFSLDCVQNRVDHDLGNIIALTDNGCANAAGNGTNGPLHSGKLLFYQLQILLQTNEMAVFANVYYTQRDSISKIYIFDI